MTQEDLLARFPDYATSNKYFAFICFALPAVFGSAITVFYNGGVVWCLIAVILSLVMLSRDPAMIRLTVALYAYFAINVVSTLINGGPDYLLSLIPLLVFLGFPLAYSSLKVSRKYDMALAVVLGSAASCFGAVILAVWQFYVLGMRAEGGAGNAIVFATVVSTSTSIVLAGLFFAPRWRVLLSAACVAGLVALLYSGSRIGWFAMIIAALIILLVHRRDILSRLSTRAVAIVLVLAFIVVLVSIVPIADRVSKLLADWQQLSGKGNYSTSLGFRAALWQIGMELFKEAPWIGHGQAQTVGLILKGFRADFGIERTFSHFHNGFLTAAVESGIFGLLALIAIFAIIIRDGIRTLSNNPTPLETFGALMLLILASIYLSVGSANVMLGHDILDTLFLAMAAIGSYLALGQSAQLKREGNTAELSSA